MNKLDLNRLHFNQSSGRGSGKTVKMLAELMGNIELSLNNELHIVFIPEDRPRHYILDSIDKVASAMGIKIVGGDYHRKRVFGNGATVEVMKRSEMDRLRGRSYRAFFDDLAPFNSYGAVNS